MAWSKMGAVPSPYIKSNGQPGSGAVLKAYLPGTTTSTSIAIDSSGTSPQTSVTANSNGVWEVSGNEIIPYIDRECKWGIFANATDAAANTPFVVGPFDNVEQSVSASETTPTPAYVETQLGSQAVSRVFTFTLFTYTLGATNTANLLVFRNGQRLTKGASADYTESTTSSITLTYDPLPNDSYDFIASTTISNATSDAENVTYTPASGPSTDVQSRLREIDINLPDISPQTLTGAGAVDVTSLVTHVVTAGTDALTLADGTEGQFKFIVMKTDNGAGTLTPTNLGNGTAVTFDDVGDSAQLIFTNGAWHFVGGTATLA